MAVEASLCIHVEWVFLSLSRGSLTHSLGEFSNGSHTHTQNKRDIVCYCCIVCVSYHSDRSESGRVGKKAELYI